MGPFTRLGVVLSLLTSVALGVWGLLAAPDVVPTHFGADGAADEYGSRWSLLVLGVVAVGVVGLFAGLASWAGGRGSLATINVPHKLDWLPEHEVELRRRIGFDLGLFAVVLGLGLNALYAGTIQAAIAGTGLPGWSAALSGLGLAAVLAMSIWMVTGRYRPPS